MSKTLAARIRDRYAAEELRNGQSRPGDSAKWEKPVRFTEYPRPEFPTECLSVTCVNFVTHVAESTQTPQDLAAMLILGVCGAALAKKVRVIIRPGWAEPTNLYTTVALAPGNRKSAIFAEVFAPVKDYEREELDKLSSLIAEQASTRRMLEGRLKNAEAAAAKAKKPEERSQAEREAKELARELNASQVAIPPQFFADDVTVEELAKLMAAHDGRMLIASAEGTIFEIARGRYSSDAKKANFDIFLKAHAGDPVRVNRVGRGPDYVDQPALSMAVTVQPDVIAGLMTEASLRGRGFLARPLYSMPLSLVGRRKICNEAVPDAVAKAYNEMILDIWRIPGTVDEHGKPAAHFLHFSRDGDKKMEDFERWLEPKLGEDGELRHLADWASKLAGAAARIAGILHVTYAIDARKPWLAPIAGTTVEAALCIAQDYLLPHAKAAFGLMGADVNVENAKHLLKWVKESHHQAFTKRDAHRAIQSRVEKVENLDPVLGLLVAHGYIREQDLPDSGGKGRKPSQGYEVNPDFLQEGS